LWVDAIVDIFYSLHRGTNRGRGAGGKKEKKREKERGGSERKGQRQSILPITIHVSQGKREEKKRKGKGKEGKDCEDGVEIDRSPRHLPSSDEKGRRVGKQKRKKRGMHRGTQCLSAVGKTKG